MQNRSGGLLDVSDRIPIVTCASLPGSTAAIDRSGVLFGRSTTQKQRRRRDERSQLSSTTPETAHTRTVAASGRVSDNIPVVHRRPTSVEVPPPLQPMCRMFRAEERVLAFPCVGASFGVQCLFHPSPPRARMFGGAVDTAA